MVSLFQLNPINRGWWSNVTKYHLQSQRMNSQTKLSVPCVPVQNLMKNQRFQLPALSRCWRLHKNSILYVRQVRPKVQLVQPCPAFGTPMDCKCPGALLNIWISTQEQWHDWCAVTLHERSSLPRTFNCFLCLLHWWWFLPTESPGSARLGLFCHASESHLEWTGSSLWS